MTSRPQCYGSMLPDLSGIAFNRVRQGKVMSARIPNQGIVAQAPTVTMDMQAWDDCLACQEYRSCYDLCMAKTALQQAIAAHR